jgi:hypothetical protein
MAHCLRATGTDLQLALSFSAMEVRCITFKGVPRN